MGFCQRCGEISKLHKCPRCCGRIVESATSGHSEASSRRDPWVSRYVDIGFKKPVESSVVKRMVTTDLTPTTHCFTCGIDLRNYQESLMNPRKFGPQQCNECYTQEYGKGRCEECHHLVLSTGGPFVQYKRKVWHKDCLKCRHCGIWIKDPLVDMVGLPCCDECFVKSGLHSSSLCSLSPRLSKSVADLTPSRTDSHSEKSPEPNAQPRLTPSPNFGRSHPVEKRVRAASESPTPDPVKMSKSKPEALYRFLKKTPNNTWSNNPPKPSHVTSTNQFTPSKPSGFATSNNNSRSSCVSPIKQYIPSKSQSIFNSSSTIRQNIPSRSSVCTTADRAHSSLSASKISISASSSQSLYLPRYSSEHEPVHASRVTALFDNKKPDAYPPASTSINVARTFSQSNFFNNHPDKSIPKSRVNHKKEASKLRCEVPTNSESFQRRTNNPQATVNTKRSVCYKCDDPIRNSWYSLPGGDTVHPECFICEGCNIEFEDGLYINFSGKFYHRKCIPSVKTSQNLDPTLNTTLPESHICRKCTKPIGESWLKLTDGSRYHLSCFTCALCYEEFEDGTFVTKDDAPYHLQCIQRPHCEACQEQINGPYVTRGSLTYHCGCFLCGICKKVIGAEMAFGETNHLVCCEDCLVSNLNSRTQGLRIRETATPLYN
ncbi:hypothetical protein K7432_004517 [Basidiobolus ranarum]|uniref:LIM zinc-binding domain-containing protein n=1 Tax=Basidiobolus ranarum TaxID=34480 RepID=A0ABR2W4I3_9FUNG